MRLILVRLRTYADFLKPNPFAIFNVPFPPSYPLTAVTESFRHLGMRVLRLLSAWQMDIHFLVFSPLRMPHMAPAHIKARYHNLILMSWWCIPVQPLVSVEGAASQSMIYLCLLFVFSIDRPHSCLGPPWPVSLWADSQCSVVSFRFWTGEGFLETRKRAELRILEWLMFQTKGWKVAALFCFIKPT